MLRQVQEPMDMEVSENRGNPLSSSIINHPFYGIPILGNQDMINHLNLENPDLVPLNEDWKPRVLICFNDEYVFELVHFRTLHS